MLPVYLCAGMVSIYGQGSIYGLFSPTKDSPLRFGQVNDLYANPTGIVLIGQNVLYNTNDISADLMYENKIFYIVPEDKIILIEKPNPSVTPP